MARTQWEHLTEQDAPPPLVTMKAIDVRPYLYAVWCTVGDDPKPFANDLVHRKWSDDGEFIWWMLDSFNFVKHKPDDLVQVVQIEDPHLPTNHDTEPETFLARRPQPPVLCPHCGQTMPKEKVCEDPFVGP